MRPRRGVEITREIGAKQRIPRGREEHVGRCVAGTGIGFLGKASGVGNVAALRADTSERAQTEHVMVRVVAGDLRQLTCQVLTAVEVGGIPGDGDLSVEGGGQRRVVPDQTGDAQRFTDVRGHEIRIVIARGHDREPSEQSGSKCGRRGRKSGERLLQQLHDVEAGIEPAEWTVARPRDADLRERAGVVGLSRKLLGAGKRVAGAFRAPGRSIDHRALDQRSDRPSVPERHDGVRGNRPIELSQ